MPIPRTGYHRVKPKQKPLEHPSVQKALGRYTQIVLKRAKPRFMGLRALQKKAEIAHAILDECVLCERRCKANRNAGKLGHCRLGSKMIISSYFDHWGEEIFLIPSFTVFFWSCNLHCQYCQNWTISQRIEPGREIGPKELAAAIKNHSYCRNVNFVGGEPTLHLPGIIKTLVELKKAKLGIPVIWNSNFYMSRESMNLLKGIIDVYLSDFKYGDDRCAERLSKVENYFSVVSRNHRIAFNDGELLIRHLILPGHIECCTMPILEFIAKKFKDKVIVNIMDQYFPHWKAPSYPEINRRIAPEEFRRVIKSAEELGLNYIA